MSPPQHAPHQYRSKLVFTRSMHAPIFWKPACSSVCPRARFRRTCHKCSPTGPWQAKPRRAIPHPHQRSRKTPSTHNTQQATNTQPNPNVPVAYDIVYWDCSLTVLFPQFGRSCSNDLEMLPARPGHNCIMRQCPNINTYVKFQNKKHQYFKKVQHH